VVLNRSSLTPHLQVEATEGRVIVRLLVLANGGVDRVEVSVSSDVEILDQAAATAVRAWRFAPATQDGLPIDAWVVVPIRFVVR
jgi:protein TonB